MAAWGWEKDQDGLTLSVVLDGPVEAAVEGPLVDAIKHKPAQV